MKPRVQAAGKSRLPRGSQSPPQGMLRGAALTCENLSLRLGQELQEKDDRGGDAEHPFPGVHLPSPLPRYRCLLANIPRIGGSGAAAAPAAGAAVAARRSRRSGGGRRGERAGAGGRRPPSPAPAAPAQKRPRCPAGRGAAPPAPPPTDSKASSVAGLWVGFWFF